MKKLLIPVDGSPQSLEAVRLALRDDRQAIDRIDLVNVQPLVNRHISRWLTRGQRYSWRRSRSEAALAPAARMLANAGVAWRSHAIAGPVAPGIALAARELQSDEIVMAATRRSLLGRLLAGSVSPQVIAAAGVPVRVVPTNPAPFYERLALPAGLGLIALWFMVEE